MLAVARWSPVDSAGLFRVCHIVPANGVGITRRDCTACALTKVEPESGLERRKAVHKIHETWRRAPSRPLGRSVPT